MVEKAAHDYAQYFRTTDLPKEINPLCTSIEEMLARLEEFESLLLTVKSDSNEIIQNNVPQIAAFGGEFEGLCKRIDSLERFLAVVDKNLSELENITEVAEAELGVPDHSLKALLKPLFGKAKSPTGSNLCDGEFVKPDAFKTSDYFIS